MGLPAEALARTSRLVAKVDSAAVQDGFELYLHSFVVAADGAWTVVQQGMDGGRRQARRYHWLSEGLESFVDDPHAAIEGETGGQIINLADRRAQRSRRAQLELVQRGRLHATLQAAADRGPTDFADLLLQPGVGARTVASLALVSEVIHGAPHRFSERNRARRLPYEPVYFSARTRTRRLLSVENVFTCQ